MQIGYLTTSAAWLSCKVEVRGGVGNCIFDKKQKTKHYIVHTLISENYYVSKRVTRS